MDEWIKVLIENSFDRIEDVELVNLMLNVESRTNSSKQIPELKKYILDYDANE